MSLVLIVELDSGQEVIYGPFADERAAWNFAHSLGDRPEAGHAHEVTELHSPSDGQAVHQTAPGLMTFTVLEKE